MKRAHPQSTPRRRTNGRRGKCGRSARLWSLCLLLSAQHAQAQTDPSPSTDRLQMPEVELAIEGSPVSLEQLLAHGAEEAPQVAVAQASRVGLARAEAAADRSSLRNGMLTAAMGVRLTDGDAAPNGQVRFLQPIEVGGQRAARRAFADAAETVQQAQVSEARWSTHLLIHQGYVQALVARERARLARRTASFYGALAEVATQRVQAGEASALEEQVARADAARAEGTAIAAEQALVERSLRLAEAAGWQVGERGLPLPEGALPELETLPVLQVLLDEATRSNPRLQRYRALTERASRAVTVADREGRVVPSVGVHYGFEGEASGNAHIMMGVVQVPLPWTQRNQAARAAAGAERTLREAEMDAFVQQLEMRIRRRRSQVQAAARRVEGLDESVVPRLEAHLRMMRRAFELGEIDLLRISLAVERLLLEQQQILDAYDTYVEAAAALEALVGVELSTLMTEGAEPAGREENER